MPILKPINNPGELAKVIKYCNADGIKHNKNDDKGLTVGLNCSSFAELAVKDMRKVKEAYCKLGGRQYQHYVLSFHKEEFSQKNPDDYLKALDYASKLAKKIWGDRFQVFLTLHINSQGAKQKYETEESQQGCLHVHIIINSVSYIDGAKIQSSADDLSHYRDINDEIAREHGFKAIDRSKEAVEKRGRAQVYSKDAYQQNERAKSNPKAYQKLQATGAVIKAISQKPKDWSAFQCILKDMGWDASVRDHDISLHGIIEDNQKYTFRVSSLAKSYNNSNITPYKIMEKLGYPNYEVFKNKSKPWKQQCADDIMFVLTKKKPKKFDDFYAEMEQLGWLVMIHKERNIRIERKGYVRKSGKPVCYSCNRLATDYANPMLSSQLIMQSCGMANYQNFAPRQSPISAQIQQESENLAKKLAEIAYQEQQAIHKPNNMVADLGTQQSQKPAKEYDSLSW